MRHLIIYVNAGWYTNTGSGVSQHLETFVKYCPNVTFCMISNKITNVWNIEYLTKFGRGLSDFIYNHHFMESPDYYLAPANIGPLSLSKLKKTILIVHDLIALELNPISSVRSLRSLRSFIMNLLRSFWINYSVKNAAFVFAPTVEMSQKIDATYDIKSMVLKNYLDKSFFEKVVPARDRSKYFLSVTSGNYSKNAKSLLIAFEALMNLRPDLYDYKLVLIGKGLNSLKEYRNNRYFSNIIILEDVGHSELLDKYRYAAAYVHPSFEEGFGRPVYEALACGTRVVVSKYRTRQKIHFNRHILTFDATDVEQIVFCMLKTVTEPFRYSEQLELQKLALDYHVEKAAAEISLIISDLQR